jgi:hypothetical protein
MLSDNGRRLAVASAAPAQHGAGRKAAADAEPPSKRPCLEEKKRSARIVQVAAGERDDREKQRLKLLDRLMLSQGRGAISRAAEEYHDAGFEFPEQQDVQLQLLEHFNEDRARTAVETLQRLLEKEPPIKRPVLDQRLRRLEEYADEVPTREHAAALRRSIRA